MSTAPLPVRRRFVDVPGGQIHLRMAGAGAGRPLVMLHSNPGSSAMLVPLMQRIGRSRPVFAPDTPGMGDSSPPLQEQPEIADYAAAAIAAIDALGLGEFDLYGTHTGANLAIEIALARPGRARHLIFDGIALYSPEFREDVLKHYALKLSPDLDGSHLMRVWHFVRDQWVFWPWYRRDASHRRATGLPDAAFLHEVVLDVLKSSETYQLSYRASFRYQKETRLPHLALPVLVASARTEIFYEEADRIAALVPGAVRMIVGGESASDLDEAAMAFTGFLDS